MTVRADSDVVEIEILQAELAYQGDYAPQTGEEGVVHLADVLERIDVARAAGARVLLLSIDSTGGQLGAAYGLYHALREFSEGGGTVVAYVDRVAASSAALFILGADYIVLNPEARVHPHGVVVDDPQDPRAAADVAENADMAVPLVVSRTVLPEDFVRPIFATAGSLTEKDGGGWIDAETACRVGWGDVIEDRAGALLLAEAIASGVPFPSARQRALQSRAEPSELAAAVRRVRRFGAGCCAAAQGAGVATRSATRLRSTTFRAVFSLNIPQALQNLADPVGIGAVVPPRYMVGATLRILRDRQAQVEAIRAKSAEMRLRAAHLNVALIDDIRLTLMKGEMVHRWERAQELMLIPFELTQQMTELPTWLAAYTHAIEPKKARGGGLGLSEPEAVRHADAAVRTMYGGKRNIDLTPLQRDRLMRHLTMFWGWAAAQLNLFISASGKSKRAWNEGMRFRAMKVLGTAFGLLWAKSIAGEVLIGKTPKDEDEDGEVDAGDVGRWVALRGLLTVPTTIPMFGQLPRAFTGETSRDISMTPWLRPINGLGRALWQAGAYAELVEADEDAELELFLTWLEAGALWVGAPATQLRSTGGYWKDRPGDATFTEDVLGTIYGPNGPGRR